MTVNSILLLAAAIVASTAGCSSGRGDPAAVRRSEGVQREASTPSTSCGIAGHRQPSSPLDEDVVAVRSIEVPGASIGSLALWQGSNGKVLGYTTAAEAVVCDLETGEGGVVGRSDPGWQLSSVAGARGFVVWTSTRVGTDGSWRITLLDVGKGRATVIRSQEPFVDRFFTIARPAMEWPYVVWSELPRTGDVVDDGPVVVAYDMRNAKVQVVASRTFPEDPSITDGLVYFSAKTAATNTRDVYAVSPNSQAAPKRITTSKPSEVVVRVRANSGWVAWALHPKDASTVGDLPLVAMRSGTTQAKRVAVGVNAHPGDGFIVYGAEDLRVAWTAERAATRIGGPGYQLAPEWVTHGRHVAFLEVSDPLGKREPAFIRVVEVK